MQEHPSWLWPAIAATIAIATLLATPRFAAPAYVAAFTLAASFPLGAGAILMIGHLTGGDWLAPIRPRLEALTFTTPLIAGLALPMLILSPSLFSWAHAGTETSHPYFHPIPTALRAAVVLTTWTIGGPWLARSSRRVPQQQRADPALRAGCAAGLIVYALTMTAASFDWIASLEPHWSSSIFGVIIMCSQALTTLAFVTGAAAIERPPTLSPDVLGDLCNLILAFVLVHTYVAFSQFFVTWNGDVPERTSWYWPRTEGLWLVVIIATVILQFALPFAATLFRTLKTSPRIVPAIAASLLLGAALEVPWTALPSSAADGTTARFLYAMLATCLLVLVLALAHPPRPRIAGGTS
jgi:hypothetical protein